MTSDGRCSVRYSIANRGEIAVRVIRTAREMGIATVAVYSDADRDALHVALADEAYRIGPAAAGPKLSRRREADRLSRRSSRRASHPPGYGFLAENAAFARRVVEAGLSWIGPHAGAIDAMGDKLRARRAMREADVPVRPRRHRTDRQTSRRRARPRDATAYRLRSKPPPAAAAKGLKVARSLDEMASAFETRETRSRSLLQGRHDLRRALPRESQAHRAPDARR